jgi:hypothetical protein
LCSELLDNLENKSSRALKLLSHSTIASKPADHITRHSSHLCILAENLAGMQDISDMILVLGETLSTNDVEGETEAEADSVTINSIRSLC